MSTPSDTTKAAIAKAFADKDAADESDSALTGAENELLRAQKDEVSAKDNALAAHQTALDSYHAALVAVATDLGFSLGN